MEANWKKIGKTKNINLRHRKGISLKNHKEIQRSTSANSSPSLLWVTTTITTQRAETMATTNNNPDRLMTLSFQVFFSKSYTHSKPTPHRYRRWHFERFLWFVSSVSWQRNAESVHIEFWDLFQKGWCPKGCAVQVSQEPRSSEVYELPNTSVTLVLSGKSMRQALFGHKNGTQKRSFYWEEPSFQWSVNMFPGQKFIQG